MSAESGPTQTESPPGSRSSPLSEAKIFRTGFSISQAFSVTNIIILVVGTIFSLLLLGILMKSKHEEVTLRLANQAEIARREVDDLFQAAHETARELAEELPRLVSGTPDGFATWMNEYGKKSLAEHSSFYGIYYALSGETAKTFYRKPEMLYWIVKNADRAGRADFDHPATFKTQLLSDTNYTGRKKEIWYHGAVESQNVYYTQPYFDETYTKRVLVSVTKSARDLKTGKLLGIGGIDFSADGLARIIREFRCGSSGGVFVTDSEGYPLAPFIGKDVPLLGFRYDRTQSENPHFSLRVPGAPQFKTRGGMHEIVGLDHEEYIYQVRALTSRPRHIIHYAVSYQKKIDAYSSLYWTLGMMALLATVFLSISLYFRQRLAGFVVENIETILTNIERNREVFSRGELGAGFDQLHPGGPREIAQISKELNLLYVRLQKSFNEAQNEKERAELATKVKSRFLSVMSHEIRTPLNSMLGLTDVLLLSQLSSEQAQHLRVLQRSGQSLLRILNDILDFSRLEAGKLQIEAHEFDLYELIYDIESLMRFEAEAKGLHFSVGAPNSNFRLYGDSIRIRQAILNLVGNAIKFTAKGSVEIRVEAVGEKEGGFQKFRFEVIDTGIGMTEAALKKIFSEFSQADSSITRRYGGTGLGLVISRQIINLLGGELTVDSSEGKGSTFQFTVPLQVKSQISSDYQKSVGDRLVRPFDQSTVTAMTKSMKPDTRERGAPARPGVSEKAGTATRILVVDDDEDNHRLVEAYLKFRRGVEADHVYTAADAIAKLKERDYALVLMDMQMPEMDGIDATLEIRKLQKDGVLKSCPIVMLSANTFAEDYQKSLDAGANEHVGKPIKLERFNALLERWL